MAERGEMIVLHEPFCNLRDYGQADAGARTFDSPLSLLAWLREPGERPEWHRSARWHADVSASSGFERRARVPAHGRELRRPGRFSAHPRPFYERLYAQRLDVTVAHHHRQ
jgi:hypothetical protein